MRPTAGVDPVSRRTFWDIIRKLANEGITILVTTHYMDEAESCDRIGFIFNSNILEVSTPKEIIQRYRAGNLEDVFIAMVNREEEKREK